jgi:hypothetical protein
MFVRVKNGQVELRDRNGCYQTFANGKSINHAVIQGDEVVCTSSDGRTFIYEFNSSGKSVYGPTHVVS